MEEQYRLCVNNSYITVHISFLKTCGFDQFEHMCEGKYESFKP